MAKSKNHTSHHNSRKNHRHGISRPPRHRYSTRRHMDPKYRRNLRYVQRGNARANRRIRTVAVMEAEIVQVKVTAEKAQLLKLRDLFDEYVLCPQYINIPMLVIDLCIIRTFNVTNTGAIWTQVEISVSKSYGLY